MEVPVCVVMGFAVIITGAIVVAIEEVRESGEGRECVERVVSGVRVDLPFVFNLLFILSCSLPPLMMLSHSLLHL